MDTAPQHERNLLCDEAKKQLEKEIAELEKKIQLYQLLLAMIEEQCRDTREKGRTIILEYEDREGSIAARLFITQSSVKILMVKPLPKTSPYTKYLLKVVHQLEEESPDITISEDGGGETLRALTVQGLSRDQVEDIILAADFVFKKMGFRKREPRRV